MFVIGLSGKMGCGKSALAGLLVEVIPGAVRMAFADPVREELAEHFGWNPHFVRQLHFKASQFVVGNRAMTGREMLQWWGTDVRRRADPGYWVARMEERLRESAAPVVVVDDVRFPGEAALIWRCGALYRLDPYPGWSEGPHGRHESETALDDSTRFLRRFRPGLGELADVAAVIAEDWTAAQARRIVTA